MAKTKKKEEFVLIKEPNLQTVEVEIVGTSPYVQHKFSQKARSEMLQTQQDGQKSKGKKKREARDIEADYKGAMHLDEKNRHGIPAAAFRSAMISACRLVGVVMTMAKLSIFIEPDCFDADDGTPLVLIDGKPEMHEAAVRLQTGVASVAIRPMWRKWSAKLKITYDADQFDANSVYNLLHRAGLQVGIGEGRPDSKKSHGMGWGTFTIKGE